MAIDGYAQYQQNQLLTASPGKLLLAAYDGAIRFCRIGSEKMRESKLDEQSININKAIAIVCELMSTLKEEVDPAFVGKMKTLYSYTLEKLYTANFNQDETSLNEAIHILTELRMAWGEAEKQLAQHQVERLAA
jgi:flagellar secretion chaperone FliS